MVGVGVMVVEENERTQKERQCMRQRRAQASRARARKVVLTQPYNNNTIALTVSGTSVATGGSARAGLELLNRRVGWRKIQGNLGR